MANICESTITVIGLKESPESFIKALSRAMFAIELDNLEPTQWGEEGNVDGKTWYRTLVDDYRRRRTARYCILYPTAAYEKLGVTATRFYVETKWVAPVKELREASKVFPKLTFHLDWWREPDGPSGELVIRNGDYIDEILRPASWYLFDHAVLYPRNSLLPAHLPYTLAQRGVLRLEDTIGVIDGLGQILNDDRFTKSPYTEHRDVEKTKKHTAALSALRGSIVEAVKQLDFEGVFLEERSWQSNFRELSMQANEESSK
jgi:hypothetical protein